MKNAHYPMIPRSTPAQQHPDRATALDARREAWLTIYRDGLLNDTLPFWFPRTVDTEYGGFLHCLDRDGSVLDTDKSVWAQGRMTWMLLTMYNTVEKRPEWLAWAQKGLEFIDRHGFDTDGRMFFQVTREGCPIRKRRYAYSESFAAIAHAAYARATGNDRSATRALGEGMSGSGRGFVLMPSASPYGRHISARCLRNYETMIRLCDG